MCYKVNVQIPNLNIYSVGCAYHISKDVCRVKTIHGIFNIPSNEVTFFEQKPLNNPNW